MKLNIKITLSVAMLLLALQCMAVVRPTRLYVYGCAFSFNDSTVYMTEIMQLDSAWTDVRTKFLYSRDNYSYQLKQHLKNQGVATPTSVILFAEKRADIEKKYSKMRKRYSKEANHYNIKFVPLQEFQFTHISAIGDPNVSTNYTKEAIEAEKQAYKQARAEAKEKAKRAQQEKKERQRAAKHRHPQGR